MDSLKRKTLSEIICGDMTFRYVLQCRGDDASQTTGILAVPAKMSGQIDDKKKYNVISLAQIKLSGDEGYVGLFAPGRTSVN